MTTPLTQEQLIELYIKSCPVFYFHKKEPYMPCDFDDMLRLSNVNIEDFKTSYKKTKMITIPEENKFNYPIGKQVLCKTLGEYMVADKTYIDLMFVLTFTWNGTRESHAFDKEQACVRLVKKDNLWEIDSIHGSIHGNGLWLRGDRLDKEDNRNVLYLANESHAIYGKAKTYKRIFGFGNDICSKDIRWMPTEFVVFGKDSINIYNNMKELLYPNVSYFGYAGYIGGADNNQEWPGSIIFKPFSFQTCDEHQNGIDTLFSGNSIAYGRKNVISTGIRYFIRSICVIIWLLFFGYIIYNNFLNNNVCSPGVNSSIYKNISVFGLQLLIVGILFMSGTYIGWEIFILSPIDNYNTKYFKIQCVDNDKIRNLKIKIKLSE